MACEPDCAQRMTVDRTFEWATGGLVTLRWACGASVVTVDEPDWSVTERAEMHAASDR